MFKRRQLQIQALEAEIEYWTSQTRVLLEEHTALRKYNMEVIMRMNDRANGINNRFDAILPILEKFAATVHFKG